MSETAEKTEGLVRGQITDEDVEKARRRIGFANMAWKMGFFTLPWNVYGNWDAFRRYAHCTGDDNPLYTDPEYPAQTRWKRPLAPPGFDASMGIDRTPLPPPDVDKETRSALRGANMFHSGGEVTYYAPIREGVKLYSSKYMATVEEKKSEFGGRSVIINNGQCYWDDDDHVYTDGFETFVHTSRRQKSDKDVSASKQAKDEAAFYTDEQLAEIDAAYDAEKRRGADTLYFEDIKVGEVLPKMVKGPLTITDLVNIYMGVGWFTYGSPPYRLAYENRKKLRGFYSKNEFNAWDSVQRLHWDIKLAQAVGVPATYDLGAMRKTMFFHYCTNYSGDDAWLYNMKYEFRRFNYMGDTTWVQGTVTGARVDEKLGPLVELKLSGTNQRGQENVRGSAVILVASRTHGPVTLPQPPRPTPHRRSE